MLHKKLFYLLAVGIMFFISSILFSALAVDSVKNMSAFVSAPQDCQWFVGDCNKSNSLSLPDIICLVNHVFQGGPKPIPACLGDCNNTNSINLADIMILVNHVFRGAPKPAKDLDGECCK